jgi:hypothetical protein
VGPSGPVTGLLYLYFGNEGIQVAPNFKKMMPDIMKNLLAYL